MARELKPGLMGQATLTVGQANTAIHVGSGSVPVLATPELVRLMEQASVAALEGHLGEGETSVGVHLDVQHLAATPVGLEVTARAELVEMDGRRLTFRLEAFDSAEMVGVGTHQRVIVGMARFLERAQAKNPDD